MKLGVMVCSFDGALERKQVDVFQVIKAVSELGFHSVEIEDSCCFEERFPNTPAQDRLREVKEFADSLGIEIPVISAMASDFLESPEIDRQVEYLTEWMSLARSIGVPILKISLGTRPQTMTKAIAFEQAFRGMIACLRNADSYGVTLAPELYPVSYPSSDVNAVVTMLNMADNRRFRHTLDNYTLPVEWSQLAVKLLAPYTVHVHASTTEADSMNGTEKQGYDFRAFFSTLLEAGYTGHIMTEWKGTQDSFDSSIQGLRSSKKALTNILGELGISPER